MEIEIITKKDLHSFRQELIEELREIIKQHKEFSGTGKPWLRSWQVKEMLGLSNNTLQTMRNNRTIGFKKVGGLMFYNYADIIKMMEPEPAIVPLQKNFRNRKTG